MRIAPILIGLAIGAVALSPAQASITFIVGNAPQAGQELVLFPDQGPSAAVVGTSTSVSTNTITLAGTSTGGDQLTALNFAVSVPNSLIQSLTLNPSTPLDLLIFNVTDASGMLEYTVYDNLGGAFTFTMAGDNGQNFITIDATSGETIESVTLTAADGFVSARNFQAIFLPNAVPEPTTWMIMLLGFGFMGCRLRVGRHRLLPI